MTLLHRPPRSPGPFACSAGPRDTVVMRTVTAGTRDTERERAGYTSCVRGGPDMRFACVTPHRAHLSHTSHPGCKGRWEM